jgi:6-pyruvoyltetrahydropterin/6-carboxytetrahydropterin synthase
MKIAKEFKWEMGHRLKFHQGKCINLHGHSYKMMVEFTGDVDENGMVLDYYDVKEIIAPLVEELDHGFLVYKDDAELIEFLEKINSKHTVVDFESTAENICKHFLEKISQQKLSANIKKISVKVFETENTYAEEEMSLN